MTKTEFESISGKTIDNESYQIIWNRLLYKHWEKLIRI